MTVNKFKCDHCGVEFEESEPYRVRVAVSEMSSYLMEPVPPAANRHYVAFSVGSRRDSESIHSALDFCNRQCLIKWIENGFKGITLDAVLGKPQKCCA